MPLGGAPREFHLAREGVPQPRARREVRHNLLISFEVTRERDEREDILLRVRPATTRAPIEQTAHELWNEIARGLSRHQCVERDGVGASLRLQQKIVVLFAVRVREVRGRRVLDGAVL